MDIYNEYLQLARLALSGREDDVVTFIQRTIRRSANSRAEFSDQLRKSLPELEQNVLRRASNSTKRFNSRLQDSFVYSSETRTAIDPIWSKSVTAELTELVDEHNFRVQLSDAKIPPSRSIMFVGPPGVGKSLAASWLQQKLGRKLLTLNLAAIMSSHLGKTGANLNELIQNAQSDNVILFIDEIDSVGKSRGDSSDIGELKRLVNILLQALDRWDGEGLFVAATNHPELLDRALWRRFDRIIDFPLPTANEQSIYINRKFKEASMPISKMLVQLVATAFDQVSISESERWVNSCLRKSIVKETDINEVVLDSLQGLFTNKSLVEKIEIAKLLSEKKISQRKLSELLGVSRDTLRKHLTKNNSDQRGSKI